jgi:hypothetical protein
MFCTAISSDVYEDLILPAAVIARLNDQFNKRLTDEQRLVEAAVASAANADEGSGHASEVQPEVDGAVVNSGLESLTGDQRSVFLDIDQVDAESMDPSVAAVVTLQREQRADKSLAGSWQFARRGKGNCIIKDGLLFCREKVCGQTVSAWRCQRHVVIMSLTLHTRLRAVISITARLVIGSSYRV